MIEVAPVARIGVGIERTLELDARTEVEAAVTAAVRPVADAREPLRRLVVGKRANDRVEDADLVGHELVAARPPDGRAEALVDLRQVDAGAKPRVHLEVVVLVPAESDAGPPVGVVLVFRVLVFPAEQSVDEPGRAADAMVEACARRNRSPPRQQPPLPRSRRGSLVSPPTPRRLPLPVRAPAQARPGRGPRAAACTAAPERDSRPARARHRQDGRPRPLASK